MMTFAEELAHVSASHDEEGYIIEWVTGIEPIRDEALTLMAKFSKNTRGRFGTFSLFDVSDAERLDNIIKYRSAKGQDLATIIRRDPGTRKARSISVFARENSRSAFVVLTTGGRRRRSKVWCRALYDVGIRTVRRHYSGTPEQIKQHEYKDYTVSRREEHENETWTWEEWTERP